MINFADYMAQERARLHDERDTLLAQDSEIQQRLLMISREMQAVDAYEAAKAGKLPTAAPRRPAGRPNGSTRRSNRRAVVIEMLSRHPEGLGRGELLEVLGVKGDKSGEMAVSNALTALVKNQSLVRNDAHKYIVAG